MSTILAFAGSNSSTSINFKLVKYTASLIVEHKVQLLNMANLPFPMYSEDYEKENGFSNALIEIKNDIQNTDGLIISVSEHNGNASAYFKNFLDWLSRLDKNFLRGKKVLLVDLIKQPQYMLERIDVIPDLIPKEQIFTSFEDCLGWIKDHVKNESTPLAAGS